MDIDTLQALRAQVDFSPTAFVEVLSQALAVPPLRGDPATLAEHGAQLQALARTKLAAEKDAYENMYRVLPQMWTGDTAVSALSATKAMVGSVRAAGTVMQQAGTALQDLSDVLSSSLQQDSAGLHTLYEARQVIVQVPDVADLVDAADTQRVRSMVEAGLDSRLAAARALHAADQAATEVFNECAAGADRAKLVGVAGSPLDVLVVTSASAAVIMDATGDGAWDVDDGNLILTPDAADRAAARLAAMSPADRVAFNKLLAAVDDPTERAYLMQALGAGHSLDDLRAFEGVLAQHDQFWAQTHLALAMDTGNPWDPTPRTNVLGTDTGIKDVSGSVLMARARVDPLYALQLSTGLTIANGKVTADATSGIDDGTRTNGEQRFDADAQRAYDEGYNSERQFLDQAHLNTDGTNAVAADELGPGTGNDKFHTIDMGTADQRSDALVTIDKTVDNGTPVPIGVNGNGSTSEEMVIVGHSPGYLEIYSPKNGVFWVPQDSFVNGTINAQLPVGENASTPVSATLPGRK